MRLGPNKWLAAALALAVVVGIGGLAAQLIKESGDPAPVVREYLDAIARGDATAANRLLDLTTDEGERLEDAEGALLSDQVLGSAVERIEVGRVETVERGEDRAVVRAELSLAGEPFAQEFVLEGAPGTFFTADSWRLTTPLIGLAAIELPSETNVLPDAIALDIGGEQIGVEHSALGLGEPMAFAALYPAVYPVSLDAGECFVPQTAQVLVEPLNDESRDRLNGIAINAMFGSIDDPDLVLPLEFSEKFTESMVESGLALAQACALEPGVFVRDGRETVTCPAQTNLAAVDACLADPSAPFGEYDGAKFRCDFYRTVTPFRGVIDIEPAAVSAVPEQGEAIHYRLGPYRFTDTQTGKSFEGSLDFARLVWVEGRPTAQGGSFASGD